MVFVTESVVSQVSPHRVQDLVDSSRGKFSLFKNRESTHSVGCSGREVFFEQQIDAVKFYFSLVTVNR